MILRDEILAIIIAEPGLDTVRIGDRIGALYADVPPGRACRLAIRLFGPDSIIAFLLSPQPSLGAIFVALDNLHDDGLIRWEDGIATPARGGRRPRLWFPVAAQKEAS